MANPGQVAALHGPHSYHVYLCGDNRDNDVKGCKTRLKEYGISTRTRENISKCDSDMPDGTDMPDRITPLQSAIWQSRTVVFVAVRGVWNSEIHEARAKVKYFGDKFAVVISDYIMSTAAQLDEFTRMSMGEFVAFMRGTYV